MLTFRNLLNYFFLLRSNEILDQPEYTHDIYMYTQKLAADMVWYGMVQWDNQYYR